MNHIYNHQGITSVHPIAHAGEGGRLTAESQRQVVEPLEKRLAVKALIGEGIDEGQQLLRQWPEQSTATTEDMEDTGRLEDAKNKWTAHMDHFVFDAYGKGEDVLFLSGVGIPTYSDGKQRTDIRNYIASRIQRLNELLARSDSVPMNKNFEPANYKWRDQ